MRTLVVYDSTYGNTEMIAQAIGETIGGQVILVNDVTPSELKRFDLVIVGSPTHGGWFTEGIRDLLQESHVFESIKVATFDTRTKRSLFGFAAPRIARSLQKNGGTLLVPPEGFVVAGIQGPLVDGELERAANWAKEMTG